jgi:hypothetical protein
METTQIARDVAFAASGIIISIGVHTIIEGVHAV